MTLRGKKVPLQNRVDPAGQLHAVFSRGMFMGNKGRLHNDNKEIVKKSGGTTGWVICALSHKGIKRELMAHGKYTELFFLDEATALAAGHRPCNDCLKEKYASFKQHWLDANCNEKTASIMSDINKINQKERYFRGSKVTYVDNMRSLPDGTFIEYEGQYFLVKGGYKYLWSFDEYTNKSDLISSDVTVLTPCTFVNVLAGGYMPKVHSSIHKIK